MITATSATRRLKSLMFQGFFEVAVIRKSATRTATSATPKY
ncbi:hypothetical protein [Anaerovibrio lipolyticus]|nr:hypothetical protein [Anaerovibrio lipolyticus]